LADSFSIILGSPCSGG